MTHPMIDPDALLATFDANDDELDIDRLALLELFIIHIRETHSELAAARFAFSYDLCPTHHCDIEICEDDENENCEQIRSDYRNDQGIFAKPDAQIV